MTALVQSQQAPNADGSATYVIPVSTAGGSGDAIVVYITIWMLGNAPISISSVSDNASGGSNTWRYSTAQQNQNPPAGGSYAPAENQYGFSAIAVCLPSDNGGATKAVTAVTVVMSTAVTAWGEIGGSEFSGLPAGSALLSAAASGTLVTSVSSYTTPSVAPQSTALVVAATSVLNQDWSSVTGGYALLSYSDTLAAYDTAVAAGTSAVAFSYSGTATDVPSSALVAIGPPPTAVQPRPVVAPSLAAIQAASW